MWKTRVAQHLAGRPEVQEAYCFGSRARGPGSAHSDYDVAVWVSPIPNVPFGYQAALTADLMQVLGDNHVDVVILNSAPPLLYREVLRGERIFSRDLVATTTREGYAISRYLDWLPQQRKIDRAAKGDFS